MGWAVEDAPDQSGRVAVVTGGNGGLGLETTRELARKGALVVMAARNQAKAEAARGSVLAEIPEALLEVRRLDLASLASIRVFAEETLTVHDRIDLLVNNAGVMGMPRMETADGFELHFGVNHLGHFALTARLMPALVRAEEARVVSVTSLGRWWADGIDRAAPQHGRRYDPWRAYGRSKLANVHFALELHCRLRAAGARVRSLVANPGFVDTDLQAAGVRASGGGASQRVIHRLVRRWGTSAQKGALVELRAATDPAARGGDYYTPRWTVAGAPVRRSLSGWSHRPEAMELLWSVSEEATGVPFDVAAAAGGVLTRRNRIGLRAPDRRGRRSGHLSSFDAP